LLAAGGVLGGVFFHYMIHGPKTPHEDVHGNDAGKMEGGK
jgi:formate dehydrogenase iron-sulfur subunit